MVRLQLQHPGVWSFEDDKPGLTSLGRVLRHQRNLVTGECEAVVLVQGPTPMGALCPTATIVYTPGRAATDTLRIDGKSGNVLTLNAAPLYVQNSVTQITYPPDDEAAATADQLAHTHVDDGLVWLI